MILQPLKLFLIPVLSQACFLFLSQDNEAEELKKKSSSFGMKF